MPRPVNAGSDPDAPTTLRASPRHDHPDAPARRRGHPWPLGHASAVPTDRGARGLSEETTTRPRGRARLTPRRSSRQKPCSGQNPGRESPAIIHGAPQRADVPDLARAPHPARSMAASCPRTIALAITATDRGRLTWRRCEMSVCDRLRPDELRSNDGVCRSLTAARGSSGRVGRILVKPASASHAHGDLAGCCRGTAGRKTGIRARLPTGSGCSAGSRDSLTDQEPPLGLTTTTATGASRLIEA